MTESTLAPIIAGAALLTNLAAIGGVLMRVGADNARRDARINELEQRLAREESDRRGAHAQFLDSVKTQISDRLTAFEKKLEGLATLPERIAETYARRDAVEPEMREVWSAMGDRVTLRECAAVHAHKEGK